MNPLIEELRGMTPEQRHEYAKARFGVFKAQARLRFRKHLDTLRQNRHIKPKGSQ